MTHQWILSILAAIAAICAPAAENPRTIIQGIGLDQKLNQQIPLDLVFKDESGASVPLKIYFGNKPVLVTLVYYRCPMLCGAELTGLITCLRAMSLAPGKDFQILTVSFDPNETPELAAAKKA